MSQPTAATAAATAAEKREKRDLAELAELKKELADAGWRRDRVTRDNLLMKRMGAQAPYRYDPLPPDVYLAIYRDETNEAWLRALAWVLMGTIAVGRNSAFVVDEYGRALDVVGLAAAMSWGIKHAEATLLELERRGFVKRDPPLTLTGQRRAEVVRRISLNAINATGQEIDKANSANKEDSEGVGACTDSNPPPDLSPSLRLQPYLRKALDALAPDLRREHIDRLVAIREFGGVLQSDALAAARGVEEQLEYNAWTYVGVKLRDRKTRAHPLQLDLMHPRAIAAGYVQLDLALELPADVQVPAQGEDKAKVKASAEPPAPSLLESVPPLVQPAAPASAEASKLEAVHAKKSRVQLPASLLPPLPLKATLSSSVEIRDLVSQSPPDDAAKTPAVAPTQTPAAPKGKTPPMKAATPPNPAHNAADAIPPSPPGGKGKTGAEKERPGDRTTGRGPAGTGLTNTPSIQRRERLSAIAACIPDDAARAIGQNKHDPSFLRRVDAALQGSSDLALLASNVAAAVAGGRFLSLGLAITMARAIGNRWMEDAPARIQEAGRAKRIEEERMALAEYAEWTHAEVERLYAALPAEQLRLREIAARGMLKTEKTGKGWETRWDRLPAPQRAEEVRRMVLLDLARGVATFDEWRAARAKGAKR
jgi:hypothetical protein